jgi:hypothetical protein
LKDDINFNYEVITDVMHFDNKPTFYMIDLSIGFNAVTFLRNMSVKEIWKVLKRCWFNTYFGLPDVIAYDAGINFAADEFKAEVKFLGITCR